MSAIRKILPLSVADYMTMEESSDSRHELIEGYMVAMAGTTQRHNMIAGNLFAALRLQLRETPCRVFMSDLKVRVDNNFYYPDLVVSCQPGDLNANVVSEALLVIEALSESTEARDRYEKRIAYQRLISLQEYVLVAQNDPSVEIYRRLDEGWEEEIYQAGETIRLPSVGPHIKMVDIYEGLPI